MTRYMRGETVSFPEALREALEDVRYPHIGELEKAQAEWLGV
jgi:hypothetical protein